MVKIPLYIKTSHALDEKTRCYHGVSLEGDRTKFIDGVNFCLKCEQENGKNNEYTIKM